MSDVAENAACLSYAPRRAGGTTRPQTGSPAQGQEPTRLRLALPAPLGQIARMGAVDGPSKEQLEIFRRMTPAERWRAAQQLYWTLRRHKAAFLRRQHPEWTDAQVETALRRSFLHART